MNRGFVSRIELRSGLRLIRTLPLTGLARSGRLPFTVPGGLRDLKIWAWQGQAGYQSVHGESIFFHLSNMSKDAKHRKFLKKTIFKPFNLC